MENPNNGRAIVTKEFNSITFTIPTKKNWFLIFFILIWIYGWWLGASTGSNLVFKGPNVSEVDTFMAVWLTMWCFFGVVAILSWLWNVLGKEDIIITKNNLSITRRIGALKFKKDYDNNHINHIRLQNKEDDNSVFGSGRRRNQIGVEKKPFIFSYGKKDIKFGNGLDYAEAMDLIEVMKLSGYYPEDRFSA